MNLVKRLKAIMLAIAVLGLANSSFGQDSLGCPNFNFENGWNTVAVAPDSTGWAYRWFMDTATYIGITTSPRFGQANWGYDVDPVTVLDHYSGSEPYFKIERDVNATDPNTGNLLKKVRPGSRYSARIGSPSGGTDATQLRYMFKVTSENALLTFYYAMVIQQPHSGEVYNNPTFQIDVVSGTGRYDEGDSVLVDECVFFEQNIDLVESGDTSWHNLNGGYESWAWSSWQRIAVNLLDYIGSNVCVRIRMADCSYSAHGAYGYFVGEASHPEITVNGCSAGDTISIATAPDGFAEYQWYKNPNNVSSPEVAILDPNNLLTGETNRTFAVTQASGIMNGLEELNIICKITSPRTQSTRPACESYLKAKLVDTKPSAGFIPSNDGTLNIKFNNITDEQKASRIPEEYIWKIIDTINGVVDTITYNATTSDTTYKSPSNLFASCGTKRVILEAINYGTEGIEDCSHIVNNTIIIPCLSVMPDTLICVGNEYTSYATCSNASDMTKPTIIWTHNERDTTIGVDTLKIADTLKIDNLIDGRITSEYTNTYNAGDTLYITIKDADPFGSPLYIKDTLVVSVQDFSQIKINGDTIVCLGEHTNISAEDLSGSVTGMKWVYVRPSEPYDMNGFTTNPRLPDFYPNRDTVVYLMAQTSQGCVTWDSVKISVVDPVLHISDTVICPQDTVILYGTNAVTYTWIPSTNPADSVTAETIQIAPEATVTYTMRGYGSNGCYADRYKTITVIPIPIPTIGYTPTYVDMSSPSISFTDNSPSGVSSRWSFSDGGVSTARSLTYNFTDVSVDSVWVQLISYNSLQCNADTLIHIPVDVFAVWVPSAFTPDGDGTNDKFFFKASTTLYDVDFKVYNRWGTVVYAYSAAELDPNTMTNMENVLGWDGKVRGNNEPVKGTYVYRLQYKMQGATRTFDKTGTINIIK
ncbi:MAG: gliding motility-associated C-terminal domain-containing protein [Bacteroidales bacterium]|jgi:gliding motility-associated-like protein|nr:gliding motility-associated C-terminal domain-containing protein [Bacteroidales bacterium]